MSRPGFFGRRIHPLREADVGSPAERGRPEAIANRRDQEHEPKSDMNRISFAQLFNALPSPHMLLDRELRYVAVNPAYEAATMRREAELLGQYIFDMFPNEDEAGRRLKASMKRVLETGKRDTLAYISYQIPRPAELGGGFEERYWTAVHSPLFDEHGEVLFLLQNTVDITELVRLRAAAAPFRILPGEMELVQRAREAEEAYRTTQSESTDLRRLFQQAPGMVAVLHGPEHVFIFANDAYKRFAGNRDFLGNKLRDVIPELEGQDFHEMLDDVFLNGATRTGDGIRVLLRRSPEGPLEEAYCDFSYNPIRDDNGNITGVFVQAYDRTDNVRFLQRQRLLLDELNHRVKNTLSAVQSIVRQSFRSGKSPAAAQATFDARIQALSKAHDVLSDRHWEAVDLKTIIMQELAPYDTRRVTADGTLVRLSPKAAIAFAMVFHELVSNATGYGSLVDSKGVVEARWWRSGLDASDIHIEWIEKGGEMQGKSLKPGFGLKMLERIIKGELDGDYHLALEPDGLICRINVSRAEVEDFASISEG